MRIQRTYLATCTGHAQAMPIYSCKAFLRLNTTLLPETMINQENNVANSLIDFYKDPLPLCFITLSLVHFLTHHYLQNLNPPKMKFSMILAVLPVAFAASGTLKAREAASLAARVAAGDTACAENNTCPGEPIFGPCDPCDCFPHAGLCDTPWHMISAWKN
ncbi:uncharacterized protein TrAtP1_010816 [Trichoderma atroviride]|uniref:uncharacterized protein n=1 Tax=Hypocrea atroviridis TaxID=63577 RepID=UPI00331B31ED|nr:hypothetical protein TrAtP1_010816 [Trichoderma atroviride]